MRVTESDKKSIRFLAAREGLSISEFILNLIESYTRGEMNMINGADRITQAVMQVAQRPGCSLSADELQQVDYFQKIVAQTSKCVSLEEMQKELETEIRKIKKAD